MPIDAGLTRQQVDAGLRGAIQDVRCVKPAALGEVPAALNKLLECVERLETAREELFDRLMPVLSDPPEVGESAGAQRLADDPPVSAPLAQELDQLARRVRYQTLAIHDTLSRLQI